jgi:hypothetical protein
MNLSIKKLVIFTLGLLLVNYLMSAFIDSVANANRGYDDGIDTLVFFWTYIIIIPGIALAIGLLAALFHETGRVLSHKNVPFISDHHRSHIPAFRSSEIFSCGL